MGLKEHLAERKKRKMEASLYEFVCWAWTVLEPEAEFIPSWHYQLLCEYLELIASGDFRLLFPFAIALLINVPPRTGKSLLISIVFPVWCWLRRPGLRFLCASYGQTLAEDHNVKRRALILSAPFQKVWGDRFSLMADRNRMDDFGNDRLGYMIATSVGGPATGFGADILIADDLLAQHDQDSEAARTEARNWIDTVWSTKRNNPATGVYIYVSQRLALDDPSGHLLETQADRLVHLKIPMEETEGREYGFPKSDRLHYRPAGDILQPQRFDRATIAGYKASDLQWAGQFMQEPSPSTGSILNPGEFRYYEPAHVLPEFDQVVVSVDCAFKAASENDYVAIQKWGFRGPQAYLLERVTRHLSFIYTVQEILHVSANLPQPSAILIEAKANGSACVDVLRAADIGPAIIEVEPLGSKEGRAHAASSNLAAGDVYLPARAYWLDEFKKVCAAFPRVKHDDDVDALTQALAWRRNRTQGRVDSVQKAYESMARKLGMLQPVAAPVAVTTTPSGPVETRVEGKNAKNGFGRPTPPCPQCGPPPDGKQPPTVRQGGSGLVHCNECAGDFYEHNLTMVPGPSTSEVCPKGGNHVWHWFGGGDVRGGLKKCDQCEEQRLSGPVPTVNGMTRAQFEDRRSGYGPLGRGSFGRFGWFSRKKWQN